MRSMMRKLLSFVLLVGLLPALRAQLDSRLVTTTDLLDVYKSQPAKPELLTVFDFSGSMHAMYWHPRYFSPAGQAGHNAKWFSTSSYNSGDFPGIVPILDNNGRVYLSLGTGYYKSIYWDNNGYFYWPNYIKNDGSGRLVQPDGNLVSIDTTKSYSQASLQAYVQQASHIRIQATDPGGSATIRTIDLPISWTVFDRVSNSNASSIITSVPDPQGGPSVPVDTLYTVTNQNNIVNDRVYDYQTKTYYYKIGRIHYNVDYLWWVFFGTDARDPDPNSVGKYLDSSTDTGKPVIPDVTNGGITWANGLSEMTRFQALKNAVVRSWLTNQTQVWWGYRFLDDTEDSFGSGYNVKADNGSASSSTVTRDIRLFRVAQNSSTADVGVRHFTDNEPSTSTPLTYALANAYTQLALTSDASSTFGTSSGGGQSGTESPIPTCRKSFVVVFTDGIANDTINGSNGGSANAIGSADPYAAGNAALGNSALNTLGGLNALKPGNSGFNLWTLAGTAAHYPNGSYVGPGSVSSTYAVPTVAPWGITTRGAKPSDPREIRTMTVGMSLAGKLTDATSGKADLFRTALYGNPTSSAWSLSTVPFDPNNPDASDPLVNPFFFDAQSTDQLASAMTAIINEVTAASASISAPSSPLVGLNLGKQAYLGLFQSQRTGPMWTGDLLMAGIKVGTSGIQFLDSQGNATPDITSRNAGWSAATSIYANRSWMPTRSNGRVIYSTLSNATTTLTRVDDSNTSFTNAMFGASSDTERKQIMRFLLGAHPDAQVDPTQDKLRDLIMGDIINSSPAALEFPLSYASKSAVLSTWLAGDGAATTDQHFRVIFVADNQGYFHAFGEVSGTGKDATTGNTVIQGAVDELWAFVPYQNLPGFKYLRTKSNSHIYLFDGSPRLYFLDQPAAGQASGDGIVNGTDTVRVVVGLGKGGRSYFSFDVFDPFNPKLSWTLNPDISLNPVIQKMGLATARPTIGRVDVTSGGSKDLIFLGGGLSTLEIDTAFSANAPAGFGSGTKMGRSIVALDILTGAPYKIWDLTATTFANMGSISSGVFPFELVPGSNRTQRLYFTDQPTAVSSGLPRGSAVWAIGTTFLRPDGLRYDSSNIDNWTSTGTPAGLIGLRKVYQAQDGTVASTLPAPFNLSGAYPVPRTAAPFVSVPAVGVAVGLGDRWDPMDRDTVNPTGTKGSGQNRFVLAFDRQDSAVLGSNTPSVPSADTNGLTDANLTDLTAVSTLTDPKITVGNASFYMATSYGYYLNLGAGSTTPKSGSSGSNGGSAYYYPKVVTAPVVLEGVGFFSVFNGSDTAGACGGSGNSKTYRICNILQPVFNSGATIANAGSFDPSSASCSGVIGTWVNIPGDITSMGTTGIIQSGQGKTSDGSGGTIGTAGTQVLGGSGKQSNYAFRPRAWRIVR